jgi:hypothetical protein
MDDLNANPNPKPGVSWGAVLGGIAVALAAGIVVVPTAMAGGGMLAGVARSIGTNAAIGVGVLLSLVIAGIVYWALWSFSRRRSADFATGIIIGGALMTLLSGGCGLLLSALAAGGGVH